MSILPKLATSLQRRDEVPNEELAKEIVSKNDSKAVKELIENLDHKDKNIQSDCIKVIYEIGERKPELIAGYDTIFLELLEHKSNRMIWGAMSALDSITGLNPQRIHKNLTRILDASDKGSVITKDHAIRILIKLVREKAYAVDSLTLLMDQFKTCATNQLPMYAEEALIVIPENHKKDFVKVLNSRLPDFEKETKRLRVEKVIQKLSK